MRADLIKRARTTSENLQKGAQRSDTHDAEMLNADAELFDELSDALEDADKEISDLESQIKERNQRIADLEADLGLDKAVKWLIWSNEHNAWWRPNSCGYTTMIEQAGLYSFEEAKSVCMPPSFRGLSTSSEHWPPPEIMIAQYGDELIELFKLQFPRKP